MNAQDALARLKEGNARFVADNQEGNLRDLSRRSELTGGQAPFAIIVSCADSRVVPELTFDTGIGELFVLRVAGNIANASTVGSIEYAVAHLGTKLIVVMGHESCGAVGATIAGNPGSDSLDHLVAHIQPAVDSTGSSDVNTVVKENAKINAKAMTEKSSIIKDGVENGGVEIVSAYYNLGDGKVDFL